MSDKRDDAPATDEEKAAAVIAYAEEAFVRKKALPFTLRVSGMVTLTVNGAQVVLPLTDSTTDADKGDGRNR